MSCVCQSTLSDPWLAGLTAYLKANQYKTTTATTLWSALSDSTGEDVTAWMQPWTYRPGFPVVDVTLGGAAGLDVMVSQVRRLLGSSKANHTMTAPHEFVDMSSRAGYRGCTSGRVLFTVDCLSAWKSL